MGEHVEGVQMAVLRGSTEGDTFVVTHEYPAARVVLALARLTIGWMFLWAAIDRVFGLGYPTDEGMLSGGTPVIDRLEESRGPLEGMFQWLADVPGIEWIAVVGLALVGLAVMLGVGFRAASTVGVVVAVLAFLAVLPPEANPVVDRHLVYAAVLAGMALANAGEELGLGRWWSRRRFVQRHPILR
jgi:thiosulfate dehydrogenase [quinone] large subunit